MAAAPLHLPRRKFDSGAQALKILSSVNLDQVVALFARLGASRLYAKALAANDNSKNQPYFGGSFEALNLLPVGSVEPDPSAARPNFKASLDFRWLTPSGDEHLAPSAQLIMYPKYPEVRFSGYLRGCAAAPSEVMGSTREPGRVLFLGVRGTEVLGYAAATGESAALEFRSREGGLAQFGVFREVPLRTDTRAELLEALRRVTDKGWVDSWRLGANGQRLPCEAMNCGGHTLEAELGITANGRAEPDFAGWEVKQHSVVKLERPDGGGPLTLFTPEPDGGFYAEAGAAAFVAEYGYADVAGRADRMNFGGVHRVGERHERTGLELAVRGYDAAANRITRVDGGIELLAKQVVVARWSLRKLMEHWNAKHAKAAYVPSLTRREPRRAYRYGSKVRLGEGTDFRNVLKALSEQVVYYDPGIKTVVTAGHSATKTRNQFRIRSADLRRLYSRFETVAL